MPEEERERLSRVAADAVAAALRVVHEQIPEASEARGLLLILGNAAISCGRLQFGRNDVLALVTSTYEQGFGMDERGSLFQWT